MDASRTPTNVSQAQPAAVYVSSFIVFRKSAIIENECTYAEKVNNIEKIIQKFRYLWKAI